MNELPTIAHAATAAAVYDPGNQGMIAHINTSPFQKLNIQQNDVLLRLQKAAENLTPTYSTPQEPKVADSKRRLVRVFIVDPDTNVPVDKCLLHSGAEQFTDATDQELFFDIDIKSILAEHNKYRETLTKKDSKAEKGEALEPIRIRDLKMVVVSLAQF